MSTTPNYDGVLSPDGIAQITRKYDPSGSLYADVTALGNSHDRLWDVHHEVRAHIEVIRTAVTSSLVVKPGDEIVRLVEDLVKILDGAPVSPVWDRLEHLEGEYDRLRALLAGVEEESRG